MDLLALFSVPATGAALLTQIGRVPIADGFGFHGPKGYNSTAMAFSGLAEGLNIWQRRRRDTCRAAGAGGETGDVPQAYG